MWKEANLIPVSRMEGMGNDRLISLTSMFGKVILQIILSKLFQDRQVFGNGQPGYTTKGKPYVLL